nr:hypothetical protein [Tanacetum cinerariifolium]
MNDVPRLQALVDKKKVIITEATIRDALRLDDAEGIDCLPNEEIFTELSRMGYEKPSAKLTFYKAFFSSQWKFLIHTIHQCMSAKRTSLNEFSSSMASAVICLFTCRKFNFSKYIFDSLVRNVDSSTKFYMYPRFLKPMIRKQVGDLSSHFTKYSSPALTQKVFANIRRVGKGFSGVETPLFEGMLVAQQVGKGAAEVNVDDVSTAGVADEGAASVADDVPTAIVEPSIQSHIPPTPPLQPLQDIPSTSQVQPTPLPSPIALPQSPQQQLQLLQDARISMDLLQNLLDTCTTLTRRVEHLEQDKIAQALEITKLKQRVKKLESRNKLKASKLRRLKKTSVVVKTMNDVPRLQALVDKKKVIITEATIRDALRLDDAEGIDCLPNEEIFTELSRMGYEKPSAKLTFYKAFFSSQWKFLIHTIHQCMSAKRTSLNEFSSSMASAVICLFTCRKFNFSKYIFDSLVRNVDSSTKFYMYPRFLKPMIRKQVGKGFSGVETPLFEGMLVAQQVGEGATEVNVDDVSTAGVADEGAASVADDVPTAIVEPSIQSHIPPTPPLQPLQDIPSTSQVQPTPLPSPIALPQSPQQQLQLLQDARISMDLLQNLLDTCTTLTRRVEHLEQDKIAQALEITKLKQRVKKLESRNKLKASKLRRLKKVGTEQRIDTFDDTVMDDEIFTELSRMGYEKPSAKLTFYKAFFSSQWKFLIHTIHQCMSAKRTSLNEFSSSMASAVICLFTCRKFNFSKYIFDSLVRNVDSSTKFYMYPRFLKPMIRKQVGDLSSHFTKYSSPALTQKVFANIRRVGKGFSGVETPLFEGAAEVNVDDVSTAGVADEGAASVADDVPTAIVEPSIQSHIPPTPPLQPLQDIPSTSQVQPTPLPSPIALPQSPQQQLQLLQDARISMDLLQNLLDTCTTLTRRVEHLEQDKIAQALEITKLKQRVKKLESRNKLKASKLRRLKKVGTEQRIDTFDDTVMDDVSKQGGIIELYDADEDITLKDVAAVAKDVQDAEIEESLDVQGRQAESQVQIYQIDLEHADKVLSMQDDEVEPAKLQEVVEVVTTPKLITKAVIAASATITAAALTLTTAPSAARRRKGVVIRDPKETATPSTIIHSEAKSKSKGKWILVEEPKPLKKQAQIKQDEAFARELEAELNKTIN